MAYQESSFDRSFEFEERPDVGKRRGLFARRGVEPIESGSRTWQSRTGSTTGFTIGGVLQDAGRFAGSHTSALLAMSSLLVGAPAIVGEGIAQVAAPHGVSSWAALPQALSGIGGVLLSIVVMRMMADAGRNQTSTVRNNIGAAGALFFPVMGVAIVSALGAAAASVLLVVPGLMLMCRWAIAMQVRVVEGTGIFASLRRSAELTKGVCWRIFGLLLVYILISAVIEFALGFAGAATNALMAGGSSAQAWVISLVQASAGMATGLIGNLIYGSIYLGLRRYKEGGLSQEVVSAFD